MQARGLPYQAQGCAVSVSVNLHGPRAKSHPSVPSTAPDMRGFAMRPCQKLLGNRLTT